MCGVPDPEVVGTGKWPEGPGRGGGCEVSWLPIVSGFHQCLSSIPDSHPTSNLSADWSLPLPLSEVPALTGHPRSH